MFLIMFLFSCCFGFLYLVLCVMTEDGAFSNKLDYIPFFKGKSTSRRASKSHYWFKSDSNFAERVCTCSLRCRLVSHKTHFDWVYADQLTTCLIFKESALRPILSKSRNISLNIYIWVKRTRMDIMQNSVIFFSFFFLTLELKYTN